MKTSDKIRFVRQNMYKNKSRLFMTILATAMGCSFLMMIASVAFGLQKSYVDDTLKDQSLTQIQIHGKSEGSDFAPVTPSDIEAFKKLEHVSAVTAQIPISGKSSLEGYLEDTQVLMTDFEQEAKSGLKLSQGRMPASAGETIVGYNFAEHLMKDGKTAYSGSPLGRTISLNAIGYDPSGKELQLGTYTLTVVGILEKPAKEWLQSTEVYVSDSLENKLFPDKSKEPQPAVNVYADSADHTAELSKKLRAGHYSIYSVADSIRQMNTIFLVLKIGLVFVGTIAVLIASIGIYNTMTMAVTERSQDIGIMKAVGTHPRTIRSIFLLESFGIGVFGSVIGAAVAYALSTAANSILPSVIAAATEDRPPDDFVFSYIPLSLTLVSVGISLGVAVLSGMRPAARATRIDVLRALRRDL
ncbi:ABC transporter permease [Paenibacillus humicola]|uniref:ABC transporter permease n=1 Tax=Paenibacillus humicola TaxID=3110540 RepID=UPI00237C167F|nr:FtsX-like permease family protein [Paenibacillus humicola]